MDYNVLIYLTLRTTWYLTSEPRTLGLRYGLAPHFSIFLTSYLVVPCTISLTTVLTLYALGYSVHAYLVVLADIVAILDNILQQPLSSNMRIELASQALVNFALVTVLHTLFVRAEDKNARRLQKVIGKLEIAVQNERDGTERMQRFLAQLSHDLRTPLVGLFGSLDQISAEITSVAGSEALEVVSTCCGAIKFLVEGLLDMFSWEQNRLALRIMAFSLNELYRSLNGMLGAAAKQRDIAFQGFCQWPAKIVVGDSSRIQQIIWNFVGNAIKFSNQGSKVDMVCDGKIEDNMCLISISVKDRGCGISPANISRIFQPFVSLHTESFKFGLGLGLTICRVLATEMHGRIEVESEVGKGSTFTFSVALPVSGDDPEPSPVPVIRRRSQDILEGPLSGLVLIAEDNSVNRRLLSKWLKDEGLTVLEATNGKEAVEKMTKDVRVVLMDLQMPVMDGFTAARIITKTYSAPVVALTASTHAASRNDARQAGMTTFLSKPVSRSELRSTLAALLTPIT